MPLVSIYICFAVTMILPTIVMGWGNDFDVYPVSHRLRPGEQGEAAWLEREVIRDRIPSAWSAYVAHAYRIWDPLHHFAVLPPWVGCGNGLATPKETADHYPSQCSMSVNAGFFDPGPNSTHDCIGNIVSDGRTIQWNHTTRVVSFALAWMSRSAEEEGLQGEERQLVFMTGYINGTETSARSVQRNGRTFEVIQLITGYPWIVRDGESYVDQGIRAEDSTVQTTGDASTFRRVRAPRTILGHDRMGRIVILVVDGEASQWVGVSLDEAADVAVALGFVNALNLDGGGSSSIFEKGILVNIPSDDCASSPVLSSPAPMQGWRDENISNARAPRVRCARPVASVLCATSQALALSPFKTKTHSRSSTTSESQSLSFGNATPSWSHSLSGTLNLTESVALTETRTVRRGWTRTLSIPRQSSKRRKLTDGDYPYSPQTSAVIAGGAVLLGVVLALHALEVCSFMRVPRRRRRLPLLSVRSPTDSDASPAPRPPSKVESTRLEHEP